MPLHSTFLLPPNYSKDLSTISALLFLQLFNSLHLQLLPSPLELNCFLEGLYPYVHLMKWHFELPSALHPNKFWQCWLISSSIFFSFFIFMRMFCLPFFMSLNAPSLFLFAKVFILKYTERSYINLLILNFLIYKIKIISIPKKSWKLLYYILNNIPEA